MGPVPHVTGDTDQEGDALHALLTAPVAWATQGLTTEDLHIPV